MFDIVDKTWNLSAYLINNNCYYKECNQILWRVPCVLRSRNYSLKKVITDAATIRRRHLLTNRDTMKSKFIGVSNDGVASLFHQKKKIAKICIKLDATASKTEFQIYDLQQEKLLNMVLIICHIN